MDYTSWTIPLDYTYQTIQLICTPCLSQPNQWQNDVCGVHLFVTLLLFARCVVGTTDSLILSPNDLSDTLLDLSDLTDQRSALESLSERDDSSNSFLDDDFEIPNSQDLEIPGSVPLPQHSCHNFE